MLVNIPKKDKGDFCLETYHLACLLARLLCRADPRIERLCGGWRFAEANENPAPVGMLHSGNRLSHRFRAPAANPGLGIVYNRGACYQEGVKPKKANRPFWLGCKGRSNHKFESPLRIPLWPKSPALGSRKPRGAACGIATPLHRVTILRRDALPVTLPPCDTRPDERSTVLFRVKGPFITAAVYP